MEKDFKSWHKRKERIHKEKERPFFHEREVWFCALGVNVGYEQDGGGKEFLRPILIIKKFNNAVLWGLPLTKTQKKGKYYFNLAIHRKTEKSTVILSQIKLIDAKRLQYKLGDIDGADLGEIKKRLIKLFE